MEIHTGSAAFPFLSNSWIGVVHAPVKKNRVSHKMQKEKKQTLILIKASWG